MTATVQRLPLTISEAQFQRTVMDAAIVLGWLVNHQRPAVDRSGRWTTATSGHVGYPDLTLARDGAVIFAELKRHGGRTTPAQRAWLTALGGHGRLWTPDQWPQILTELRNGPPAPPTEETTK